MDGLQKIIEHLDTQFPIITSNSMIVFVIIISIYIIGISISSISFYVTGDLYDKISCLNKKYKTFKISTCIIYKVLYYVFRKWSPVETMEKLVSKRELQGKLKHINDSGDVFLIAEILSIKQGSDVLRPFFKSQFYQLFSNVVFYIFVINNIIVFRSMAYFSLNNFIYVLFCVPIYVALFFIGKGLSSVFVKKLCCKNIQKDISVNAG